MMLSDSLRYFKPLTVQLVTQDRIFSSRMPTPGGTSLSKLPPSIYVNIILREEDTYSMQMKTQDSAKKPP